MSVYGKKKSLEKKEPDSQEKELTKKIPVSKKYLLFWLFCWLLVIIFPVIELFNTNHIFLQKSLKNVITVYNKYEALSNVLALHMDSMSYPESRSLVDKNIEKMDGAIK